ncbi:MAG: SPFH domain-containing protein [Candidatus Riflebacteria bacterium]|nr:SPFH domain-containing protein [Candidatus Riflebacteria bacterium]
MFWIGYFKGEPHEFVLVYRNGVVTRRGQGISFFFWRPSTSIVCVPTGTIDVPFILNETVGSFQAVTVQGQMTFRVTQPETVANLLNFALDPDTRVYRSEDPEKLSQRIINEMQTLFRLELQKMTLEDALRQAGEVAQRVLGQLRGVDSLTRLGVEVVTLHVISAKPTPEMAKALEAEYRENLQIKADQAIYKRRALAVDQERRIKENELTTSITLETQRQQLVALEGQNVRAQAEFEAAATTVRLAPFKEIEPAALLAMGLKDLGANAAKIGQVNITPELLAAILQPATKAGPRPAPPATTRV